MPKPSLAGRKRIRELSGQDRSHEKKAALLALKAKEDKPTNIITSKAKTPKPNQTTIDTKAIADRIIRQYRQLESAGTPNRLHYTRQEMHRHLITEIKKAMLDLANHNHDLPHLETKKQCQLFVDDIVRLLQRAGIKMYPLQVIAAG